MSEWRPVTGYEEGYEVSDEGDVRSLPRLDGRGHRINGQTLTATVGHHGRKSVELWSGGVRFRRLVHRLVLEAFVGPAPIGTEGCHNNGDCLDNQVKNLRWDTHPANILDAVAQGTHNHVRVTHCPRGHQLTDWNNRPYEARQGNRSCRACGTEKSSAYSTGRPFDTKRADAHYARYQAEGASK